MYFYVLCVVGRIIRPVTWHWCFKG